MKTKDKILLCALNLFSKNGIDGTSTAQISKDAGVATGTLFVHFSTKQDLINTLYVNVKREAFATLINKIDANASVEKNIKQMTETTIYFFLKNYNAFVFMEMVDYGGHVSQIATKAAETEYSEVVSAIFKWKENGELKQVDLDLIISTVWSYISNLVKYYKRSEITEVKPEHLDILWDAISE